MRTRLKARAVLATVFYGLLQVSMASISFPEIQPIMGFPQLCTKAYSTTITDCELDEFPLLGGSGCSANCQIALEAAGTFIQRACASLSAPGDSLIGQIFIGNVIDFLCTPTSSQTTTTMTTAAASPSSSMSMASDTMTTSSTASQAASSAVTTSSSSAASVTSAGSTTTTTTKESSSVTKSSSASRSTSVSSSSSLTTTLSTSSTSTSTSSSTSTTRTSSATQASSAGNGNTGGSGGGSPFDEPFSTGTGVLVAPHHQLLFLCLVGLIFILR
ncbi:hypothetical protein PV05_00610 [Exophiala xenobiotica]|uniref:Extracellular membrane protein CFEM domain-containing protein n=1 Tax=Exophiala xenobiotica TaxID=348802 RepID=A0A0D2EXC0_9EURO|nr:uncharacterized protein PV05_00610 [Exophiala xenobiotica]KIW60393.1 hypothetical protein PV05_00610 [Exophiala xenobiotica]